PAVTRLIDSSLADLLQFILPHGDDDGLAIGAHGGSAEGAMRTNCAKIIEALCQSSKPHHFHNDSQRAADLCMPLDRASSNARARDRLSQELSAACAAIAS